MLSTVMNRSRYEKEKKTIGVVVLNESPKKYVYAKDITLIYFNALAPYCANSVGKSVGAACLAPME